MFYAPLENGGWDDLLTDQRSVSLGEDDYVDALRQTGFKHVENRFDETGSHYYLASGEAGNF